MDTVDLRQAPHLLPVLAKWHQHEWAHLNPGETLSMRIERMQSYLEASFMPTTLVIVDNNKPLGSAAIVANDMDTHQELTPWLASVFVHPDHRCKGIASELIQQLEKLAVQHAYKQLHLFTPDQESFYTKRGWQTLSQEYYHHEKVTLMRREL